MRIAAIYDVHGNLPALEAVLAEVDSVHPDLIVFGGDLFDGPLPRETLARVQGVVSNARFVRGNGERLLLEHYERRDLPPPEGGKEAADFWCATQLTPSDRDFLADFERSCAIDIPALGRTLFCHATPRSDDEIVTPRTPDDDVREALAGVDAEVVVFGHTHIQGERVVDGVRLVNPGSVGWAYADEPGAYWAVLADNGVEYRRTTYDLDEAGERIRQSEWPVAAEFADENVLTVPSVEDAIAGLEKMRRA